MHFSPGVPAILSVWITIGIVGCGSTAVMSPLGDGGAVADASTMDADGAGTPPAGVFVNATLGPHLDANNNDLCPYGSPMTVLQIGTASVTPIPVVSGGTFQGAPVAVACAVTGGFALNLTAGKEGFGQMTIDGNVDLTGGAAIAATIISSGITFTEANCTIAYTFMGSPVPTTPVARGRVWGHLSCPSMTDGQQRLINGGRLAQETCDGEADFRFENCTQ